MAGAAVAVLALAGGGALMLSKGNSQSNTVASQGEPQVDFNIGDETLNTSAVAVDENAVAADTQNAAASEQSADQTKALETLHAEQAKSAAAEAQLAQLKKAAAKAAAAQSSTAVPGAPARKGDRKATVAAETNTVESEGLGVSAAKLAQFNSIVDDGRSMAKQAMRSSNRDNVQLAKNYDKYLKTLKDSMRGIQSDREAEKLIKQASQTRAYIQFLVRQQ